MCKALEEWEEKIRQEERQKERQESIRFNIRTCKKFNIDKDAARTEYHGRIFTIRAESHGVCKIILVIFLKNLESILKLPNICCIIHHEKKISAGQGDRNPWKSKFPTGGIVRDPLWRLIW